MISKLYPQRKHKIANYRRKLCTWKDALTVCGAVFSQLLVHVVTGSKLN